MKHENMLELLQFRAPAGTHESLKALAARHNAGMSDIIRAGIEHIAGSNDDAVAELVRRNRKPAGQKILEVEAA